MFNSWLPRVPSSAFAKSSSGRKPQGRRRRGMSLQRLDERTVFAVVPGSPVPGESVQSGFGAADLAQSLVGPGVSVSNASFVGGASSAGSFTFTDATVIGFGQGIVLSSGNVADIVGPNMADSTSTDFANPGDTDLTNLAGYETHDAAVLEFDFVPTANQVVFQYTFASDEYPEWVNTVFNDVFAFYVNGTNYAVVRQTAGDPNAAFVPVAVNNINDGNPLDPAFVAARPDLFRPNYVDPNGAPSALPLELDGLTRVLTFQAPVTPGVVNHMKLAIADASDGIYDSAVFIQAGSLVSNSNPVADLSLLPISPASPSQVTAVIEAEDPNGSPLTYTIDWGDGTFSSGQLDTPTDENEKTALVNHLYAADGNYYVTLTVSNGALSGSSTEDIQIGAGGGSGGGGGGGGGGDTKSEPVVVTQPVDQEVVAGEAFIFTAEAIGEPVPEVQWQISTDGGATFSDIAGAKQTTYTAIASLENDGAMYQAVFSNDEGEAITAAAMLIVVPATPDDTSPPSAPIVTLANDTGGSDTDLITNEGWLALGGIEDGALVEYSIDGGLSWSADFSPLEGANSVQVRQTDEAGNTSDAAILDFLLDTQAPAALDVVLAEIAGNSAGEILTNNPALQLGNREADATVEYSTDGGATWSPDFTASEGLNTVEVRQVDLAGNASSTTSVSFTLDTVAPTAPLLALEQDTGASASDLITKIGTLKVSGMESGARVEFSSDGGATWAESYTPLEGWNLVSVRQIDAAGNASPVSTLNFRLDNIAPQLSPSLSTGAKPILVNEKGVTAAANASDLGGIFSQTAGLVNTAAAGAKTLVCTATDLAGNTTSVTVSYTVGYAAVNVKPSSGATYKKTATIPVSFQLKDANGLISDAVAASLASKIKFTFDSQVFSGATYNKKTHSFSYTLKPVKPSAGAHELGIHVFAGGSEVTTVTLPLKLV